MINKSMVSPDLHAFQCVVCVSKAGTRQRFPQTGPVGWLGLFLAAAEGTRSPTAGSYGSTQQTFKYVCLFVSVPFHCCFIEDRIW